MTMSLRDEVEKFAREHHLEAKIQDLLPIIGTFDQRNQLFSILQSDVQMARDAASQQVQNQYLRRTVVRTTFAMIEGLLNILSQTVLAIHDDGFAELSKEEM